MGTVIQVRLLHTVCVTALDESIGVVSVILTLPLVVTSVKCNRSPVGVNPTDRLMVGEEKKKLAC